MSLKDLAGMSGIPALEPAVALLFKFYESLENIKVYKEQCKRLHGRCVDLLLALRHNHESLFGTDYQDAIDKADLNFEHIAQKVKTWSEWGSLKSWVHQGDIKQGLDELNRDLIQCATRLNMIAHMESFHKTAEMGETMDRRHVEIEEKLQRLLANTKDIHIILSQPNPQISGHMLSIQQAIHEDTATPETRQSLQQRLLSIHRETELLPPMIDLTGEVRRIGDHPVDITGGFSDVYLGEWLGNEKVALKLTRGINQTPRAQRRFTNEVGIWRQLQHKNVARLYGVATLGNHIYAVSPWMEHRDALRYITNNPRANRLKILAEVATGLEFLHRHGVVHGDLRAANILISDAEVACITDFGLSVIVEEEVVKDPSANSTLDLTGNSRWMAPELINPELIGLQVVKRNTATDTWSYGMLCLEILTGQRPFPNRPHGPAVISDLITGVRPTRPSAEATRQGLSDAVWELMQQCWAQNPQLRPKMSDVVRRVQALRDAWADNPSQSSPIPIPKHSKDIVESPVSITPTGSHSTMFSPSPTSLPNVQQSSRRSDVSSTNHFRMAPLIQEFTPRPSPYVPDTIHVKSASIDVAPSRGKKANTSGRPSTAPGEVNTGPPQLPCIGEIHSEISGEGPEDLSAYFGRRGFTDPTEMPTIRVERPSTPEKAAVSTSLPTSHVIPAEHTAFHRSQDIPPSEGSWMTSTSSELSQAASTNANSPGSKPVYIKSRHDGSVEAANLPGLVERLILDSNDLRTDMQFRETFLTSYQAFTDAGAVFSLLLERFDAVSSSPHTAEQRTSVRFSVITVLDLWLQGHHVESKDIPLLHRMRQFALSIQSPTAAPTLKSSASRLTQLIDKTVKSLLQPAPPSPSSSLSSSRSVVSPSEMTPEAFAAALTELESNRFKKIIPSDCIGWLKGINNSNGVSQFIAENNKISYWVQKNILKPDDQFRRSENLRFFLCVTEECRRLRNFSAACALFAGLASSSITGLKRTSALDTANQKLFQSIEKFMSQDGNFRAYREVLNASQAPCVPWLRVHLHDLKVIHGEHRTFIKEDGHSDVINFGLYERVYERIRHILSYQDPPPKHIISSRHLEIQAFIESQLRSIVMNEAFHGWSQQRAAKLAEEELTNFATYRDELIAARFIR